MKTFILKIAVAKRWKHKKPLKYEPYISLRGDNNAFKAKNLAAAKLHTTKWVRDYLENARGETIERMYLWWTGAGKDISVRYIDTSCSSCDSKYVITVYTYDIDYVCPVGLKPSEEDLELLCQANQTTIY